MEKIRSKLRSGELLSKEDTVYLLSVKDDGASQEILSMADELNRSLNGDNVSYVVNQNINFTNVCALNCSFCAYKKKQEDADAYVLTIDDVLSRIDRNPRMTEVTVQGGLNPRIRPQYYFDLLSAIKKEFPYLHIHAFSPMEIYYLAQRMREDVKEVLKQLRSAGLDSLCGTAAEIFDPDVRRVIAPAKIDANTWKDIIITATEIGIPTTATVLFGHIETPGQLAEHLFAVRDIQLMYNSFTEFIPLLFIPFKTPLGQQYGIKDKLPIDEVYRMYGVSRLFFGATIRNLQVSWVKLGMENAVKTFDMGVNDIGGTLLVENITRSAGGEYETCFTEDELIKVIKKAGKNPIRRDTQYMILN